MKRIFVDTSALVALFDRKDDNHAKAKTVLENITGHRTLMLITDYIFDECITTVQSAAGHQSAVSVGEFILESKIVEIKWLDKTTKLKAWEYFKKHSDKNYSFTDCASFVLMKELRIERCFSFDAHFRQAGFIDY